MLSTKCIKESKFLSLSLHFTSLHFLWKNLSYLTFLITKQGLRESSSTSKFRMNLISHCFKMGWMRCTLGLRATSTYSWSEGLNPCASMIEQLISLQHTRYKIYLQTQLTLIYYLGLTIKCIILTKVELSTCVDQFFCKVFYGFIISLYY